MSSGAELGARLEAHLADLERRAKWIEVNWNRPGPVARRLVHLIWLSLREFVGIAGQ